MIRVAVLGNSHLAAWKLGWGQVRHDNPDFELTFFGSPAATLSCLRPENGRLVPDDKSTADYLALTSGGQREIVVADFDYFCLVGLGHHIQCVMQLYTNWRADSHNGKSGEFSLVSDAVFEAAALGLVRRTLAMGLVEKLRSLTQVPMFLAAAPAPSEGIVQTAHKFAPVFRLILEAGDDAAVASTFKRASQAIERPYLTVLDQPSFTLACPILTKADFSTGAVAMDRPLSNWDQHHMNPAFGAAHLNVMLDRIQMRETSKSLNDASVGVA